MTSNRLEDASLLLIDDEEANLDLLEGLLLAEGYERISRVQDPRGAMETFEECAPDLVLLDLHMPFLTGYDVLERIRERVGRDDYLPVLVLTADVTPEARDRALSRGAQDFLTKPFDAVEVLLRVRNLLETRMLHLSQHRARLRAESAERQASLRAEASRRLSASLDAETGLTQVAKLCVPEFAGSLHYLLEGPEGYRVAAGVNSDGTCGPLPGGLEPGTEPLAGALGGVSGTSRLDLPGVEILIVPLQSQSRRLGAVVAIPPGGRVRFTSTEEDLLLDLAGRSALALENAHLFADAQMATRARERMLSVVAHDLRNPLAVIAMYAEMMLDLLPGDTESETETYSADALTSIYRSAHQMQEQIESLLDVSRLHQGTFAIRRAACDADGLFTEAEFLLRPLAEGRRIALRVQRLGGEPAGPAHVDGARFQQVLSNLVGNAVKFSPEGGEVTITWETVGDELRVSVADSGAGIPAEKLPHVFGAFWQATDGDRRGLGLGLWIARAIVEAHGGRIWVDSVEGQGATFHFTISVRPDGKAGERGGAGMGSITHESPQIIA